MIDDNKEKLAYSLANRRLTIMRSCMSVLAGNASSRTKHGHRASQFVAQNRHRELKHTVLRVLYNELLEAKSPAVHDAEQFKIQKMRDRKAQNCMVAWRE